MINPETLDLSSLPSIPLESKSELPNKSAIYFAIDSQEAIQYIGRTTDLNQRWECHHRFKQLSVIGGVRIAYLFLDSDLLPEIEDALIAWFEPNLNKSPIPDSKKNQISFTPDSDIKVAVDKFRKKWKLNQSQTINRMLLLFTESKL